MKHYFLSLIIVFSAFLLSAQSIQNDVISSGGASSSSANLQIEYTIGEPVIETFETTNLTLTQGFHQPSLTITSIEEPEGLTDISFFPNPVTDELTIEIPPHYSGEFLCSLFDLNGKLLSASTLVGGSNTINMHSFATGTYLLQIRKVSTSEVLNAKILKTR